MDSQVKEIHSKVEREAPTIESVMSELKKRIVGQEEMLQGLLIGLLAKGHILVEGVPGLAKTLTVKTLSEVLDIDFKRIQFTPDLLPSDIVGTLIYNQKIGEFEPKKGPVFTNFVLADEINRAPAKVQAALLEAMQEKQVTIGERGYKLDEPFLVMATQNPIEQEGTYNLPEAQIDRFMLKIKVGYPKKEEEKIILDRMISQEEIKVSKVLSRDKIVELTNLSDEIYISDRIKNYIVDIVHSTREPEGYNLKIKSFIDYGASPRASIFLARAAKANALLSGRGFVTADDIKSVSFSVLRHRIILSYEAEAEGVASEDIITQIFNTIMVP
ncbi:MAG TPA: MoxR family ATPase [Spirochaetota bacterium]|jgi:MoxR-like ATPase|nr:MAG: ATPase family associated with various cellular activities (AAA) [Spirochaetes bacterium ADurb.Bin133]HNZ26442.1 MoxR family ATPase [Spirochaetota bacterium]HOE99990.1 MoxR family ATPase [Spirochaetota bacterium]HOS55554.1 MoxR family ATPase [Spirochaetota bacterium]HPK63042.1 MoxR family ATPase [Spirochaetota bacterium]